MDICHTFKDIARKTWNMLEASRRVRYPMQEETFTDLHLLHLKQFHPEVKIVHFNKKKEGVNGADWEWWIRISAMEWIGYRVQAKVLDVRTDTFNQLYYRKDTSSVSQCDKLIAAAKADKSNPCIPLYVLYLHSNSHPTEIHQDHGCSLVGAYKIKASKSVKSLALADWKTDIVPWHELVCSASKTSDSRTISMQNLLNETQALYEDQNISTFISKEPPSYVYASLNSDDEIVQFDPNPHDIAGALIFDLNSQY